MNLRDIVKPNADIEEIEEIFQRDFELDAEDLQLVYCLGNAHRDRMGDGKTRLVEDAVLYGFLHSTFRVAGIRDIDYGLFLKAYQAVKECELEKTGGKFAAVRRVLRPIEASSDFKKIKKLFAKTINYASEENTKSAEAEQRHYFATSLQIVMNGFQY